MQQWLPFLQLLPSNGAEKRHGRESIKGVPSEIRNIRHVDEIPMAGKIRPKIFFTAVGIARNFASVFSNTCGKYVHKKKLAYERKKKYQEQVKQAMQEQVA